MLFAWCSWASLRLPTFDPAAVRAVVAAVVAETPVGPELRVDRLRSALMDAVGPWSLGAFWARSAGGVVAAWCCPAHTAPDGVPADVLGDCVIAALTEWQGHILTLDRQFEALTAATRHLPAARAIQHAAAALLPWVVEATGADDAWYATFTRVLAWWREAAGSADPRDNAVIHRTLSGRFESWSAPAPEVAAQVCADLGAALVAMDGGGALDALSAWAEVRPKAFTYFPEPAPVRPGRDAHAEYIQTVDAARDPLRAARILEARQALRAEAGGLSGRALLAANAVLLGAPAQFRTTVAWSHAGRVRYPVPAEGSVAARLDGVLAEAYSPALPLCARAARLYLDVCFLHPFVDGNARAARVALDALLWSEGWQLGGVGPLFSLLRAPDDPYGAVQLVYVLGALMVRPG